MIPFGPRLIGQTEKTLNAILDRFLAGTGVTEPQWVALNVIIIGETTTENADLEQITRALKTTATEAALALAGLTDRGYATTEAGVLTVTDSGRAFHARIQQRTAALTDRLWGDISADDRRTTAAVLNTVLERATGELTAVHAAGAE
jgi:DNA-binding MarR family transcriptional regulator